MTLCLMLSPARTRQTEVASNDLSSAPSLYAERNESTNAASILLEEFDNWEAEMEMEMSSIKSSYIGTVHGGYQTYPVHFTLSQAEVLRSLRQIPVCTNMTVLRLHNCRGQHRVLERLTRAHSLPDRKKRGTEHSEAADNVLRYLPFFGNFLLAKDTERSFRHGFLKEILRQQQKLDLCH